MATCRISLAQIFHLIFSWELGDIFYMCKFVEMRRVQISGVTEINFSVAKFDVRDHCVIGHHILMPHIPTWMLKKIAAELKIGRTRPIAYAAIEFFQLKSYFI